MACSLVRSFAELEWGIRPALEEWAEVTSFDAPGVGGNEIPPEVELDPSRGAELLSRWRDAAARIGVDAVDRRGWERFVVVTDSYGAPTAVCASPRCGVMSSSDLRSVTLLVSHSREGERAPERAGVFAAMVQLARQGSEAFVRYGIAQMTRGGIDEDTAQKMVERFPDMELVTVMLEALAQDPEPIGEDLAALESAAPRWQSHEGCLGSRSRRGFRRARALRIPRGRDGDLPGDVRLEPRFRR